MFVDMAAFTPWSALAGGALIGLAAGLFAVANGRIAGISGLLGSLLQSGGEGGVKKCASCWDSLPHHFHGNCSRQCLRFTSVWRLGCL